MRTFSSWAKRRNSAGRFQATVYLYDEDTDTESAFEVDYTVSAYDPGVLSGPPENCYPPEGGEIEIQSCTPECTDKQEEEIIDWILNHPEERE